MRGRAAAAELVEQLNSLFGLRHCGRTLPRREHPSAYGQMGRCLSPCLHDLDPNLYRERLDAALQLFVGRDGGKALLERVDQQTKEASAERRYERAAWLQRRRARLEALLGRLGGVLRATHTGARLVLAPHPEAAGRFDAIWIAGGRVVDWGLPPASRRGRAVGDAAALAARSARAFRAAPGARQARRLAARRRGRGGAAGRRLDRRQPASCPRTRGPDGGGGTRRLPRPGRSASTAASSTA